jgi:hypothetical protein
MSETIYPKGIRVFKPHDNAPDFVKGTVIITMNELFTFCKENENLLSEYNGNKQLKCQLLDGDKGMYMSVDTWKPEQQPATTIDTPSEPATLTQDQDDLPF